MKNGAEILLGLDIEEVKQQPAAGRGYPPRYSDQFQESQGIISSHHGVREIQPKSLYRSSHSPLLMSTFSTPPTISFMPKSIGSIILG